MVRARILPQDQLHITIQNLHNLRNVRLNGLMDVFIVINFNNHKLRSRIQNSVDRNTIIKQTLIFDTSEEFIKTNNQSTIEIEIYDRVHCIENLIGITNISLQTLLSSNNEKNIENNVKTIQFYNPVDNNWKVGELELTSQFIPFISLPRPKPLPKPEQEEEEDY